MLTGDNDNNLSASDSRARVILPAAFRCSFFESEVTRLWREGVPQKQGAMSNGMVAECRVGEDRYAIGAIFARCQKRGPGLRRRPW